MVFGAIECPPSLSTRAKPVAAVKQTSLLGESREKKKTRENCAKVSRERKPALSAFLLLLMKTHATVCHPPPPIPLNGDSPLSDTNSNTVFSETPNEPIITKSL